MANQIQFVIGATDKFSGTLGKFNSTLGSILGVTAKLAAGAVAAGTAVTGFATVIASGEDKAAKMALRIGASVTELTKLQFAAEQSGVKADTLNMAMQRLTRRTADAVNGMGEAVPAFKAMGINAEEFAALPLDKKMETLTDKLSGVADKGERVRLAFKLFDSEGVALLQMMDGGSAAMKKLTQDAEFLGVALDKQAAANATALMDAMGRTGSAITGVSRGIADKFIPILTGMANATANAIASMRGDIVAWTETAVNSVLMAVVVVQKVATRIYELVKKMFTKEGIDAFATAVLDTFVWLGNTLLSAGPAIAVSLVAIFKAIGDAMFATVKWAWDNVKAYLAGGQVSSIGELLAEKIPEAMQDGLSVMEQAFADLAPIAEQAGTEAGDAIAGTLGLSMGDIMTGVDELKTKFQEFGAVVQETNEITAENTVTLFESIGEKWNELMEKQGTVINQMATGIVSIMDNAVKGIGNAVGQTIVYGGSLLEGMRKIMKSVAAEVISMLVQIAIQRIITSNIITAASIKEGLVNIAAGAASAFANVYSAIAGIPYIGPFLAPVLAIAAGAAVFAGGRRLLGQAHAGLDNVPSEGTYLLQRGERVLAPEQNRDLTTFLNGGGQGETTGINVGTLNVHVMENVTTAEQFLDMPKEQVRRMVAGPIIDAFNELSDMGIKPRFVEQLR